MSQPAEQVDIRGMLEVAQTAMSQRHKTEATTTIWELLQALERGGQLTQVGITRNCTTVAFNPGDSTVPEIRCAVSTLKRTRPGNCSKELWQLVMGNVEKSSDSSHGNGNGRSECHTRRSRIPHIFAKR